MTFGEAPRHSLAQRGASYLFEWQYLATVIRASLILPECVIDATFAWLAAGDPAYAGYAAATMTGANPPLLGGGGAEPRALDPRTRASGATTAGMPTLGALSTLALAIDAGRPRARDGGPMALRLVTAAPFLSWTVAPHAVAGLASRLARSRITPAAIAALRVRGAVSRRGPTGGMRG